MTSETPSLEGMWLSEEILWDPHRLICLLSMATSDLSVQCAILRTV